MVVVNSLEKLEKDIESWIKSSYSNWDYIRCYNLMKLMCKVNKENKVLLNYVTKVDEKKIEKLRKNWVLNGSSWIVNLFKSPKLYVSFFLIIVLWKIK